MNEDSFRDTSSKLNYLKEKNQILSNSFYKTTKFTDFINLLKSWSDKNSLSSIVFGSSCCSVEYSSTFSSKYNLEKFGVEFNVCEPNQADLLIVATAVTEKMVPYLKKVYDNMLSPKYVIAMGSCASSGGVFRSYNVVQGISREIPVDIYIPGCPPSPEAILDGVMKLKNRIRDLRNTPNVVEVNNEL